MGKASRQRKARAAARAAVSKSEVASTGVEAPRSHPLVADTAEFISRLRSYIDRLDAHGDLDVVDLPRGLADVVAYGRSEVPDFDLDDIDEAWEIVLQGRPVHGAVPHPGREHESHRRWKGPQTPGVIIGLAKGAPVDAGTYRDHLAANIAFQQERDAREALRSSLTCGRATADGRPCGSKPAYLPASPEDPSPWMGFPARGTPPRRRRQR